jgi:hypothetical protein
LAQLRSFGVFFRAMRLSFSIDASAGRFSGCHRLGLGELAEWVIAAVLKRQENPVIARRDGVIAARRSAMSKLSPFLDCIELDV